MRKVLVALLATTTALVACGGAEDKPQDPAAAFEQPFTGKSVYPQFASSDLAVGENRVLVGLLNDDDAPIGSPGIKMDIDFYDLGESATEPVATRDMQFLWSIKPQVGLYSTNVSFDSAGKWGAEVSVTGEGYDETVKTSFKVQEESSTPAIGEKAPPTDTPTSADAKLEDISTDKHPDPRFYKTSVKEALAEGKPFVLIFATPKFCQSQTCGPMLDIVKGVSGDFPKLTFIHVEPYKLPADPSNLQPVASAAEWGLPSEPWVFVVDGTGKLVAKFEGAIAPEELASTLKKI